ncbi:MAG TPA: glycogen synthase, partial [Sphaerochaeta sp.]|nr:glycogen synthase [Sphaerochaeta sp.]
SSIFLMPSAYEPCGLGQLIAMRYGTVPVVRETGGLKDTVARYDPDTGDGNGFTFDDYSADLLLDTVKLSRKVYLQDRDAWDRIVVRDMGKDVSWEHSAREYLDLYKALAE